MKTLKITEFTYNLVDPPYNFYGVQYVLDGLEHVVYIPISTIAGELETQTIVEIVCAKLRVELDCVPVHIDRITRELKDERRTKTYKNYQRSRASRLGEHWKSGVKLA